MKANELMIGDWVQDRSGAKMKIVNIEYHCTRVLLNGEELILAFFEQANLMPIPLTPEILEKNGFEKALQVSDTEPFDTDEEGNKHYSYNKTFWGWWQSNNIFCIPANGLGWLNIKYVHQLQHALRLCGIDKEIEL